MTWEALAVCSGLNAFAPNINIFRDPRWGRGSETYGEDPLLTGTLAEAFVQGMQGNDSMYTKVGHLHTNCEVLPGMKCLPALLVAQSLTHALLSGCSVVRPHEKPALQAPGPLVPPVPPGDNPYSAPVLQVGATCKHFAAYSLEQSDGFGRYFYDAKVTNRCA